TAHLAVTYYYFPAGSSQLNVGFSSSLNGGATWTPGRQIAPPMQQQWVANTNQGYMVGDYISTSFTGDGKAHPIFSLAKPPPGRTSCYPGAAVLDCSQRLTSAAFDITAPPVPPVPAQHLAKRPRLLHRFPNET